MKDKPKFYAVDGMEKTEIQAEEIELHMPDGRKFVLYPRRSDGNIALSTDGQLVIVPRASNLCYINEIKWPSAKQKSSNGRRR